MKTLLFIKQVDFWGQVFCVLAPAFGLVLDLGNPSRYFVFAYCAECIWQLISFIVNGIFLSKFLWSTGRMACNSAFIFILVLFGISILIKDVLFAFLIGMIFIGPLVAAWYLSVSYREMIFIRNEVRRKQFV